MGDFALGFVGGVVDLGLEALEQALKEGIGVGAFVLKLVGVGDVVNVSGRQVVCRADVFSVLGERTRLIATALATLTRYK